MPSDDNRRLIEQYWQVMGTNDFHTVGKLLHDDFLLEYPQSGERIRGRDNNAAINEHYPAAGEWKFTVHRVIADETGGVSEVTVTDGSVVFQAISFFEVRESLIWRMTEYWPDPFDQPEWRSQWVESSD